MAKYSTMAVRPVSARLVAINLLLLCLGGCRASISHVRDDKACSPACCAVQLTEGTWWFSRPNLEAEHWKVFPDFDQQNHYQKTFTWNAGFVPKHVLVTWTALRTGGVDANGGLACGIAPTALTDQGFTIDLLVAPNVLYAAGKWEGISP